MSEIIDGKKEIEIKSKYYEIKLPVIVMVEWHDAVGDYNIMSVETAKNMKPAISYSVGFLLRKDDEVVVLTYTFVPKDGMLGLQDNDNHIDTVTDSYVIPIGMVKSIRTLTGEECNKNEKYEFLNSSIKEK